MSTESQFCVTALGHIRPGDLFAEDGTTTGRACSSGTPGCAWTGIESATPWNDFMETRASEHGKDEVATSMLVLLLTKQRTSFEPSSLWTFRRKKMIVGH